MPDPEGSRWTREIRRRPALLLCVAALFLIIAAATAPTALRPERQWVGFNDISIGYHVADAQQDAALSARAGAEVSRITIDWRSIEPERGRYEWAPYDRLVSALRTQGIRPLLVILFAPHWAWAPGIECDQARQDCKYPPGPAHDDDWRIFVAAAVRRYPDALAVEVWNEPNLSGFWSPQPDPPRYSQLLREAAEAVRAVAPAMPVLVGGLAPVERSGRAGVTAPAFLSAIYATGGRPAFDGIGVHLYPCSSNPAIAGQALDQVRVARAAAGDTAPLWITEVGVTTSGRPPCGGRSESEQAEIMASTYTRLRAMGDVRAVIVHTLIDRPGALADRESGFGVFRRNLSPKPAACVFLPAGKCTLGEGG